jgi:protein TonB
VFQESLVSSGAAARKTWSFAISLLAQTAAICVALVATIAYTPLLPAAGFAVWLEAPPPPPGAPPPPQEPVVVQTLERYENAFVQPTKIPEKVADIIDPEDFRPTIAPTGPTVPGGDPNAKTGVIGSWLPSDVPPPRPPEPKPVEKAPEPPPPSGPVQVSSTIQAAKLIRRVQPSYPIPAKSARISGTVRLRAIISEDGSIEQLSVLGGHPFLVQAAVQAVKQWRYRPTLLNGRPVQVATEIEVNFVLSR